MKFIKMQGLGNDFVMLDMLEAGMPASGLEDTARLLCDRHTGVGSDGLIIVSRASKAPYRMDILNADGTNGGMCGNGVRCTARLLIEKGYQALSPFELEVGARVVRVEPLTPGLIRVDMGLACLERSVIGVLGDPEDTFIAQQIHAGNATYTATAAFTGNPHLVVFCEDPDAIVLEREGPMLERHELFPHGINVHFVSRLSSNHLKMRPWERGVGATMACGSGACCVGVAGYLNGLTERKVQIDLPGGTLSIEYREDGHVIMEGPAERVFEGEWSN